MAKLHRLLIAGFGPTGQPRKLGRSLPIPYRFGLPDWPGDVNFTALQATLARLSWHPTEIGIDLLSLGLAVYATDLCTNRETDGDDAWTRHLDIDVEVSDPDCWSSAAESLAGALRFLSNDVWRFSFRQRNRSASELGFRSSKVDAFRATRISLFSGGLDSAIGAIDALRAGEAVLLASVAGERQVAGPQNDVYDALSRAFPGSHLEHAHQHVRIPSELRLPGESSQRARSFLFLAFAVFLSTCYSPAPLDIIIPENGLIALNVPTDPTRMGANSTKTTHPFFLARFRDVVRHLGLTNAVEDPYRFATKGEMIASTSHHHLRQILPLTVSCAKAPQLFHQGTGLLHCGSCTACIIRRASIYAGWPEPDPTPGYWFTPDLFSAPVVAGDEEGPDPRGEDIRAFKAAASRIAASPERAIVDIYRSGPMIDVREDIGRYADVYRRGMLEINTLLQNVRTVAS